MDLPTNMKLHGAEKNSNLLSSDRPNIGYIGITDTDTYIRYRYRYWFEILFRYRFGQQSYRFDTDIIPKLDIQPHFFKNIAFIAVLSTNFSKPRKILY